MTVRCTNATVAALGCPSERTLLYGTSVIDHLVRCGFSYEPMHDGPEHGYRSEWTLKEFIESHPTGMYYLSTTAKGQGHAMALVDGVLTDTACGGLRRKVSAIRIYKEDGK